ncbi:phosphoinositide phosphatase SAC3 [Trifolium repens]|nr:phosphoinositide phosphatase SAC3 [Trifolium repens]
MVSSENYQFSHSSSLYAETCPPSNLSSSTLRPEDCLKWPPTDDVVKRSFSPTVHAEYDNVDANDLERKPSDRINVSDENHSAKSPKLQRGGAQDQLHRLQRSHKCCTICVWVGCYWPPASLSGNYSAPKNQLLYLSVIL